MWPKITSKKLYSEWWYHIVDVSCFIPEQFDAELDTMMYKIVDELGQTLWACSSPGCDKRNKKKSHMRMHVETHIVGIKHKCDFCLADFKTRSSLSSHVWKFHRQENVEWIIEYDIRVLLPLHWRLCFNLVRIFRW